MKEIRDNARKLMKDFCRVCPRCNGVACAGQVPGMGGIGTGSGFRANIEALDRFRFNMRLIHDVIEPVTSTKAMGLNLALPLIAAPIGGVTFNMGGGISEESYISSVIDGCKAKGIIGSTGDGVPEFIHKSGFKAIKDADGHGIPFIKPWEDDELYEKISSAVDTGCRIIGMDIDAAGLITLRKMGRPVSPKNLSGMKSVISYIKNGGKNDSGREIKFILKGVMTPDEAALAVEAGADAIVVSNHGGRVLDSVPGSADVLESIAAEIKGKITILVDGGVRTGGDILKMVALGADAVMIGRPFSVAAIGGLKDGVEKYIDTIEMELRQSMVMTGVSSVEKVDRSILFN